MADFGDTSSYPKASLPVSPLDVAGKIGTLQQQKLQIDQAKLDQANQGLTYMTRAMGSLGPGKSPDEYIKVAQNAVDMGLVPQNMLHIFEQRIRSSKDPYSDFMTAAAEGQKQMDYHLGVAANNANGQTVTPTVRSVKPGFGERPIGLPVQQQAPPTQTEYDKNNKPRFRGAVPAEVAPGNVAIPTPLSVARPAGLPVERPTTGATGPTVRTDPDRPASFAERTDAAFPKPQEPRGASAGPDPLFEEGKKAYTEDQRNAGARAFAIKPAIQALKLMPGLSTGPGTSQFTDLVAAAKAWGIVDTKAENDPTVLRQELEKKLAQYVGSSPLGQRSDAQQALAEAGSPNPKKQILPALQALTRDAIALDRVQILKPQAFKGQDYQSYIKHQGVFPGNVDEKALTLDLLPEADRTKLVKKMAIQYEKGNAKEKAEANRFKDTLKLAHEAGMFNE